MRYVVIDFEATCDEPYNAHPQELIEFPAVVIDTDNLTACPEFHTYVRPVAHPRLTAFCTRLTGIKQAQVDAAPTFPEVIQTFDTWWQATAGSHALSVTCGDWDLGSLLPRQCAQHRLSVPAWADCWVNIKRLYEWHFPRGTDRAHLADIAASLGVTLEGRLHSGMDDARNIARVMRMMLARGVPVENTAFWNCAACGVENLQRDRACSSCGRERVKLRAGGWHCPGCRCPNFGDRTRCFDCGIRKPGGGSAGVVVNRSGWQCWACGSQNTGRGGACFKCGQRR